MEVKRMDLKTWAPLAGKWEFDGLIATYTGPEDQNLPYGIALSNFPLHSGVIKTTVSFDEAQVSNGRDVIGYNSFPPS
jgi:hypothetical protein